MNSQVFGCPSCSQPFRVLAEQAGQVIQCPSCAQTVEIPASAFDGSPSQDSETPTPDAQTPESEQQVFACVYCQGQFGITPDMFGIQVACPHCKKTLEIQDPTQSELASPKIDIDTGSGKKAKSKSRKPPAQANPNIDSSDRSELFAPGFSGKTSTSKKKSASKNKPAPQPKQQAKKNRLPRDVAEGRKPTEEGRLNPNRRTSTEASSPKTTEANQLKPSPETTKTATSELQTTGQEPTQGKQSEQEKPNPNSITPKSIAHLLPPTFDVFDPTLIRIKSQDEHKVAVPDGRGGAKQLDQRVLRVEHQGEKVTLVAMSSRQKFQRRLISNILAILIGIAVLALAFKLLT